ncbi:MAG: tRNA lysidine(34) synthetase TilS [Alphaproteobacteria bacterium]|nr:tRNA lysidine(34) synthetase TilS [Alphaproteobacteria bacterium]
MAILLPDGALLERFRGDLAALTDTERVAVAVSGGPDSLALLLLAAAARPGAVEAATVDHGLRPESAAEAASVAGICADLSVPHAILRCGVGDGPAGLQAEARKVRYATLGDWMGREGLQVLLTAHHADDQAETLLMRLQRGAGVGGLAGVRARGPLPESGGRLAVCRPLLAWRRAELAAIVAAAGLTPVDDPSNADPSFDRARIRRRMAEAPWLDVPALARSAAALAQADAALDAAAARLFDERVRQPGGAQVRLDPRGVPDELVRRLVLRCLRAVSPAAAPRGEQVSGLIAALAEGGTATLAGVKCRGGETWHFAPAPPRRARAVAGANQPR